MSEVFKTDLKRSITAPPGTEGSKLIKKDALDYLGEYNERVIDYGLGTLLGINMAILAIGQQAQIELGSRLIPFALSMAIMPAISYVRYSLIERQKVAKLRQETLSDSELPFQAKRLVYRGKEAKVGNILLNKGDNVIYVNLPAVIPEGKTKTSASEQAQIASVGLNLYNAIFRNLGKN